MVQTRRSKRVEVEVEVEAHVQPKEEKPRPVKRARRVSPTDQDTASTSRTTKRPKSSKNKEEPKLEDYPARASSLWKVGLHPSAVGGIENAVQNAAAVGANAFALFLKSQRQWTSAPLKEESIKAFKSRVETLGYSPLHILPHGSYLINLGNPDDEKREKSYVCFLDDLRRCEQLGLTLYNFHPGSTVGSTTSENCISLIAECINRAHKETNTVITVVENMAGSGNVIGSTFEDLAAIIRQVEDKGRVAVCLDTCHMFASGHDIRTKEGWESTISDFDEKVGLSYLRGIHLNDSKTGLGSKKDRHENIGLGHLGLVTFHHILNDPRMQNLPLILETPTFETPDIPKKEIGVLNRLSGTKWVDVEEKVPGEVMVKQIKEEIAKATRGSSGTSAKIKRGVKKGQNKKSDAVDDDGNEDYDSE